MEGKVIFFIALFFALVLALGIFVNYNYLNESEPNEFEEGKCVELGCPSDTEFVGSLNSDKYYPCDCRYASSILSENVICFFSTEDAENQNYVRSDC